MRIAAVRLLGQGPSLGLGHADQLATLLTPRTPVELQSAAVTALSRHDDPSIPDLLTTDWAAIAPGMRREIIAALLSRPGWMKSLLQAVQQQTVMSADFNLAQQHALLHHADGTIRQLAEKCFQVNLTSSRQEMLNRQPPCLGKIRKRVQVAAGWCTPLGSCYLDGVSFGGVIRTR